MSTPWRAVVDGAAARCARAVARDVASRLRDAPDVEAVAALAATQSSHPETMCWEPCGMAHGYSGLALLGGCMEACFPCESWDAVAHSHLERAARSAAETDPELGIFSGMSGLAFATAYLSRGGKRYSRLTSAIDATLLSRVCEHAAAVPPTIPTGVSYFDLISGMSGMGACLLNRAANGACADALRQILTRLVTLCTADDELPRWWTPRDYLYPESRDACPDGNLNCGLAHGIPGPLALMSLALLNGVEIEGLRSAIARAADWLCAHRADDAWGVNWPYMVPLHRSAPDRSTARAIGCPEATPSRTAWCYGAPGVARALWLAGRALERDEYRELALTAMRAVFDKPVAERGIPSPTFCHGVAGLLQITLRFAHEAQSANMADAARDLCEQLLALYDPQNPLGYRSVEEGDRLVDNPGLLDGAAGVALVLLAVATDVEPKWDRLFLLS